MKSLLCFISVLFFLTFIRPLFYLYLIFLIHFSFPPFYFRSLVPISSSVLQPYIVDLMPSKETYIPTTYLLHTYIFVNVFNSKLERCICVCVSPVCVACEWVGDTDRQTDRHINQNGKHLKKLFFFSFPIFFLSMCNLTNCQFAFILLM